MRELISYSKYLTPEEINSYTEEYPTPTGRLVVTESCSHSERATIDQTIQLVRTKLLATYHIPPILIATPDIHVRVTEDRGYQTKPIIGGYARQAGIYIDVSRGTEDWVDEPHNHIFIDTMGHEYAHAIVSRVIGRRRVRKDDVKKTLTTTTHKGFTRFSTLAREAKQAHRLYGIFEEPLALFFGLDCVDEENFNATTDYGEETPLFVSLIKDVSLKMGKREVEVFRWFFKAHCTRDFNALKQLVEMYGNKAIKTLLTTPMQNHKGVISLCNEEDKYLLADTLGLRQDFEQERYKYKSSGLTLEGIKGKVVFEDPFDF